MSGGKYVSPETSEWDDEKLTQMYRLSQRNLSKYPGTYFAELAQARWEALDREMVRRRLPRPA